MIISFAWTTPALLAGAKTMTRRHWLAAHGSRFHVGDLVDAWDHSPRAHGKKVATIVLTRDPWRQRTSEMTVFDRSREGIDWLVSNGFSPPDPRWSWDAWWADWRDRDELVWVVEFELAVVVR